MQQNLALTDSNLNTAEGFVIGALSGLMTGIAAGADVCGIRNVGTRPLVILGIRIRWVTTTAFTTAQALAFRVNKVYGFTAVHDTGTPVAVQAHHLHQSGIGGTTVGDRIALTEISTTISSTAAISISSGYTAEDADEPDVFAVGAGSTLPGVYEDWTPPGLPLVLPTNTGLVINNHILMGAAGVGNLYVGVDGYRKG